MLIDWDDAATPPTRAAEHLKKETHAPEVFKNGHEGEVDVWGVGRLILDAKIEISPGLEQLGDWMSIEENSRRRPSASEALEKIKEYVGCWDHR